MRMHLKSTVPGDFQDVFLQFDEKLFRYLLPPNAELINFEGSKRGDKVHLKFGFPFYSEWISEIVEEASQANQNYFIDEGRKLPFGLKTWRHRHIVRKSDAGTEIIDEMNYSTGNSVLDILFYPFLFLAFAPRIVQYKKYFKSKE